MDKNKELRTHIGTVEVRANEDGTLSRTIEGYAVVFDRWSRTLGWFKERVSRSAFENVDMTDVVATFNHDFNQVMARTTANTLTLSVDDTGMKYRFEAPNTTAGNDLLENIRNGNIVGSSFMFSIKKDTWTHDRESDEYTRTIDEVENLYELGPVVMPAYPDTTAAQRSFDEFKKDVEEIERPQDRRGAMLRIKITRAKNQH
jgi:HK97 family phage prohead protease